MLFWTRFNTVVKFVKNVEQSRIPKCYMFSQNITSFWKSIVTGCNLQPIILQFHCISKTQLIKSPEKLLNWLRPIQPNEYKKWVVKCRVGYESMYHPLRFGIVTLRRSTTLNCKCLLLCKKTYDNIAIFWKKSACNFVTQFHSSCAI